jgi:4'-phosphopantetheinyl transferase
VTGQTEENSPILNPVTALEIPDDLALVYASAANPHALSEKALSAEERGRLSTFGREDRRCSFILGRTAARTLLAERMGIAPPDVPLHIIADGALDVPGHPLRVSIAHTGKAAQILAMAAVAARPVGVDLERIAPRVPDLYRRILRPDEYALLDALGLDHNTAQVLLWSLKEAVLKGLRTGFQRAAQSVYLTDVGEGAARADTGDGASWMLRYARRDDLWVTVAWQE